MKIVLCPNPYRDKGLRMAQRAREILEKAGAQTVVTFPFKVEGEKVDIPSELKPTPSGQAFKGADLMLCFGGDGTILHVAKEAQAHGLPVLGVNLGSVGFMAELEVDQLDLLPRLLKKDYQVEERMMLDVQVRREGRVVFRDMALNDAVVCKGSVARIIEVDVKADGELVGHFPGDGVIVATPTGSTAYSMAALGPIVEPTAEAVLVTPICSHVLHAKSFVLDRDRTVTVIPDRHSNKTACLSVDGGKAFRLKPGDRVEVRRSAAKAGLVKLTGKSFYAVMNQKLGRADR